jgi:hypothetical protein
MIILKVISILKRHQKICIKVTFSNITLSQIREIGLLALFFFFFFLYLKRENKEKESCLKYCKKNYI